MRQVVPLQTTFRYWMTLAVITALYMAAGKLGLSLAFINTYASAVWPPTGIALTVLLIFGFRMWPAIFVGAFLTNFVTAGSPATSVVIALGNTLEALFGAWCVNKFSHGLNAFDRPTDIFKFLLFAAFGSTLISATIGSAALYISGSGAGTHHGLIWLTWWLGDMVSNVIIAPFLIVWSQRPFPRFTPRQFLEFTLLIISTFFVSHFVFGGAFFLHSANYPLQFLCIPLLLWASFRFGLRGASLTALLISGVAVWGTVHGRGPFVMNTPNESLLILQAFLGVLTTTILVLSSVLLQGKRAEKGIQEISLRKSAILDASLDCIVTMDAQGNIIDFNPAAERTFGYSRQQVVGQRLAEKIIPLSYREAHQQGLARYLKTGEGAVLGKRLELTALRSDGSEFPVELAINVVHLDHKPIFTAHLRDLTERKRAEEDRLLLAAIVESSEDAIVGKTLEGIITSWNKGAERLYGYKADEIIGRPVSVLAPFEKSQEMAEISERLKTGGHVEHYETTRVRKDKKQIHVSVTTSPIKNALGQLIGVSAIARDITEKKLAEEALRIANARLAELVALKDEFVASVSHELRTPLTAIKEGVSLIIDRVVGPLNEEQEDFLKTIDESVNRLNELINNLLDLSKIEAGRFRLFRQRTSLPKVIDTLLASYKTISGHRTVQTVAQDVPDVFADSDRLLQILGNLFSNAIKFTQDNGTIIISAQKKEGYVAVSVEDNGVGIAKEDVPKLFKKFSQVGKKQAQGTGLGLSLVKQLVEMHQGTIFVTSKPGKGACFTFTLPIYVPHISEAQPLPTDADILKKGTVYDG